MCESNVFLIDENGEENLYFESVDKIVPEEGNLVLENIFGERRTIQARIKEMTLVNHRVVLQK